MTKFKQIRGLTAEEVERSRAQHGTNDLPPPEVQSFWQSLKENFEDPIIRILLVALVITLALAFVGYADWLEGFGIAVAVFIATFVSTYSEYKNETSFRELQEQASKVQSEVFRNGQHVVKIPSAEIVVGDFVLLQAGDKIPADGQLCYGELQVDQSSINGEKIAVRKTVAPANYVPVDKANFEDQHLVFRGSVVDDGEAVLRVDAVGKDTFYGQLYNELASAEDRESPLQVKLSGLADDISKAGYIGSAAIAVSFLFKQFVIDQGYSLDATLRYLSLSNWHQPLHDVVTAIILAVIVIVVAVPEGLPMMIAIVLSLNMRKLLKAKVLVRKLLGIETAGSVDIMFVDKTGTLTKGLFEPKMFLSGGVTSWSSLSAVPPRLRAILTFALRESTSAVISDGEVVGGNASDRALLQFLDRDSLNARLETTVVHEILFNSARKFSATQVRVSARERPFFVGPSSEITLVKGAPDYLLPFCKYFYTDDGTRVELGTPGGLRPLTSEMDEVSRRGIRLIAVATSEASVGDDHERIPQPLTLVGVLGIADEVRRESKPALQTARSAGIQVVMITGDRKETAVSVAEQLGLLDGGRLVLTSAELKDLSDIKLQEIVPRLGVIARALPTDKSRLVRVCQGLNQVVGMTGDGVNDSAALKAADVGFSMGSGSEVAKEASDIVIMDDNFASITQAVLYGRTIFKSIRKFIVFQSTINFASFIIVFLGPFLGFDFPLTLIQLLWVNLVMDTLAAMAFGGEAALARYMTERPIKRDAPIISAAMWSSIVCGAIFIATLCIAALSWAPVRLWFVRDGRPSEDVFLTCFFAFFIFLSTFNAFNVRTASINLLDHLADNSGFVLVIGTIFVVQIVFTYLGGSFLRTVGLTMQEWFIVTSIAVLIIPFDMARKMLINYFFRPTPQRPSRQDRAD